MSFINRESKSSNLTKERSGHAELRIIFRYQNSIDLRDKRTGGISRCRGPIYDTSLVLDTILSCSLSEDWQLIITCLIIGQESN